MRQAPASSTTGWLLDLAAARGPRFVVVRADETEARQTLIDQLVEVGNAGTIDDAAELVDEALIEPVEVIW